jgi:hypothetical protein
MDPGLRRDDKNRVKWLAPTTKSKLTSGDPVMIFCGNAVIALDIIASTVATDALYVIIHL